jgi:hypothetical protein
MTIMIIIAPTTTIIMNNNYNRPGTDTHFCISHSKLCYTLVINTKSQSQLFAKVYFALTSVACPPLVRQGPWDADQRIIDISNGLVREDT